jgi:hypothetical protein
MFEPLKRLFRRRETVQPPALEPIWPVSTAQPILLCYACGRIVSGGAYRTYSDGTRYCIRCATERG